MTVLFDSTNFDVSREGLLPQGHVIQRRRAQHFAQKGTWRPGGKAEPMTMLTSIQSAATPTMRRSALLLVARVRRFLNGWVAAAIAYRERQVALLAPRQLDDCRRDSTRIYRGPIDAGFEKVAQHRKRRRHSQP
jgi:hypothetical protein